METVCVIQARMGSTRMPGKVLESIDRRPLLSILVDRVQSSKEIDDIIIATTTESEDDAIEEYCIKNQLSVYRGSRDDVLDRYYQAISIHAKEASYIVRITADCPLIDPALIDKVILFTTARKLDYGANVLEWQFPDGQDVEVINRSALEKAWSLAKLKSEREHVTPFIIDNSSYKNGTLFESANYSENVDYGMVRLCVDEPADFKVVSKLLSELGPDRGWKEYADLYLAKEEINELNRSIGRNEGYEKSIKEDGR